MNDTLFYLGANRGYGLKYALSLRNYEKVYVFEALPEYAELLARDFACHTHIQVLNYAVAEQNGKAKFYVSSNNGESSSFARPKQHWELSQSIDFSQEIEVATINLFDFCKDNKIDGIYTYISDIQGMDLTVLRTMEPLLKKRAIRYIQCETARDAYGNIYEGLPDNSLGGFYKLLGDDYNLVSIGGGVLEEGKFGQVTDGWWEFDALWKAKE